MDRLSQLQKSLDEMKDLFSSRMSAFESASSTASAVDPSTLDEYSAFKSFIWSAVESLQKQMGLVLRTLEEQEMRFRSVVLLLHGVPEADTEEATVTVLRICRERLGIQEMSAMSLYACYRLGKSRRGKKPRPVVVKFACHRTRDTVWAEKRRLKGTGFTFSEFLTSTRHAVFVEARRIYGVDRSWTSDGRIVVLGQDNIRYRVASLDELRAIPPDVAVHEDQAAAGSGGAARAAKAVLGTSPSAPAAPVAPAAPAAASAQRGGSSGAPGAPPLRSRPQRQKSQSRLRK